MRMKRFVGALLAFAFLVWAGSVLVGEMAEKNEPKCTRYEQAQAIASGDNEKCK